MKASLRQVSARATELEKRLVDADELAAEAIDGDLAELESALHEIAHVVTLRGSLRRALRTAPILDVDAHMRKLGLYGIMRDENEVSTIAVELLTADLLGHPIDRREVVRFAWINKNVVYFDRLWRFDESVVRRMQNPRCRELARELARYLSVPLRTRKRNHR